jgi:enoyl-CoA hydratase/carnithine racemase
MNSADPAVAEIQIPPVLNPETITELSASLAAVDRSRVRFLILRGEGAVFCNGLDIQWIAHNEIREADELTRFSDILKTLHVGPFITIAIVEGEVTGGGMGILAACDFVFATGAARFSLTEGLLGFIPGIILPFLLDKLSSTRIKKMVFAGSKFSVQTMVEWGLVHECVTENHLEQIVADFIRSMKSCKPLAIKDLKRMLSEANDQRDLLIEKGVDSLMTHLGTPAVKERLVSIASYLNS